MSSSVKWGQWFYSALFFYDYYYSQGGLLAANHWDEHLCSFRFKASVRVFPLGFHSGYFCGLLQWYQNVTSFPLAQTPVRAKLCPGWAKAWKRLLRHPYHRALRCFTYGAASGIGKLPKGDSCFPFYLFQQSVASDIFCCQGKQV